MDISIVIPMHDEEEALVELLPALEIAWRRLAPATSCEMVLMDDGSTDATFQRAWTWAETVHFPVKVLRLNPREGIGGALRAAFGFCIGEIVVTYDADMSYPLEDIAGMAQLLGRGHDVVTASPFHPAGAVDGVEARRMLTSRAATALYRLRLGRRARGLSVFTCGFRAYRREILGEIINRHDGFLATAELLVNALRKGYRVAEMPSVLRPRRAGRSKMKTFRTTLTHLGFLLRLR